MKGKLKAFILFVLTICFYVPDGYAQKGKDVKGKLINLNGTSIFVNVVGAGEPIIIIHGGPVLDHSYLIHHFDNLANDYRLIFYDQRLSGHSSADVDTSNVNIKMFVNDIEALREHLGLQHAHILGHSWGGLLAMEYAIAYPTHTRSLILSNAMPPNAELWKKEQTLMAQQLTEQDSLARQKIMQSSLLIENPSEAIEELLLLSFKNQFYDTSMVENLKLYIPEDYMARSQLFGNLMAYLSTYDLTEQLNKLNIPALIIYGSEEPGVRISGPVLNEEIQGSTLNVIEESGHFPFIEKPEQFFNLLKSFLSETN